MWHGLERLGWGWDALVALLSIACLGLLYWLMRVTREHKARGTTPSK